MYKSFCDSVSAVSKQTKAWSKVPRQTREQVSICIEMLATRALAQSAKVANLAIGLE